VGDEDLAEHLTRLGFDIGRRTAEVDPTLKSAFERAFAPSPRVDLRLDDQIGADFLGRLPGLFGRFRNLAPRAGHTVFVKKLLGLVFVDVHLSGACRARPKYGMPLPRQGRIPSARNWLMSGGRGLVQRSSSTSNE